MKLYKLVAATTLAAVLALSPARAAEPIFERTSYSLYLPNEALVARGPAVEPLVEYLKAIEEKAGEILARQGERDGVSLSLVIGIKPGAKSKLWVVAANSATAAQYRTLLSAEIEAIPVPEVRGYNAFAINADLWGGNGWTGALPLPFPAEWIEAAPGGLVPDAPLSVLMKD
jgi:hypothetical protein